MPYGGRKLAQTPDAEIRGRRKGSDLVHRKNPAERPGLFGSCMIETKQAGSIFRDNRGRSEQIEFVIESDLDLVLLDVAVSNEAKAREG